jgi:indolepyruvate ferredoxin oxidoreductase
MEFGAWMLPALRWLAKRRHWRGTRWNLFGRSAERQTERQLLADYEADIDRLISLLPTLNAEQRRLTTELATELAALPEKIRGYGHVKAEHLKAVAPIRERLRAQLGIA